MIWAYRRSGVINSGYEARQVVVYRFCTVRVKLVRFHAGGGVRVTLITLIGFTDLFQTLEDASLATAPIIVTCYCRCITLRNVRLFLSLYPVHYWLASLETDPEGSTWHILKRLPIAIYSRTSHYMALMQSTLPLKKSHLVCFWYLQCLSQSVHIQQNL